MKLAVFLWPEYPPTPDSQTKHYELTSWGPKRPFAIQAWVGPKILVQVTQCSDTRSGPASSANLPFAALRR